MLLLLDHLNFPSGFSEDYWNVLPSSCTLIRRICGSGATEHGSATWTGVLENPTTSEAASIAYRSIMEVNHSASPNYYHWMMNTWQKSCISGSVVHHRCSVASFTWLLILKQHHERSAHLVFLCLKVKSVGMTAAVTLKDRPSVPRKSEDLKHLIHLFLWRFFISFQICIAVTLLKGRSDKRHKQELSVSLHKSRLSVRRMPSAQWTDVSSCDNNKGSSIEHSSTVSFFTFELQVNVQLTH